MRSEARVHLHRTSRQHRCDEQRGTPCVPPPCLVDRQVCHGPKASGRARQGARTGTATRSPPRSSADQTTASHAQHLTEDRLEHDREHHSEHRRADQHARTTQTAREPERSEMGEATSGPRSGRPPRTHPSGTTSPPRPAARAMPTRPTWQSLTAPGAAFVAGGPARVRSHRGSSEGRAGR
jgi:hypothetical protein